MEGHRMGDVTEVEVDTGAVDAGEQSAPDEEAAAEQRPNPATLAALAQAQKSNPQLRDKDAPATDDTPAEADAEGAETDNAKPDADGDEAEDPYKGLTPEWKSKVQATERALRKANREAAKLRKEATAPTEDTPEPKDDGKPEGDAPASDGGEEFTAQMLEEIRAEGRTEAEQAAADRYKPMLIAQAAEARLVAAGLQLPDPKKADVRADALARVVQLIKMDQVEVTDAGKLDGLDDQVAEIKEQFPQLFMSPSRPSPKINGADREPGPEKPIPATIKQRNQHFGISA